MMKFAISILFIFSILLSCQKENRIELDFNGFDFPQTETADLEHLDSILSEHKTHVQLSESDGIYCYTDKTEYALGEQVILTIENNSKEITEFLYPGIMEDAKQLMNLEMMNRSIDQLKDEFDKVLISKNPAFVGQVSYSNPAFVYLMIDAMGKSTADKFGYDHFGKALKPGEKMVFQVDLPNRAGFYSFLFVKHSHDPNNQEIWGLNKFIYYSNAFEVSD